MFLVFFSETEGASPAEEMPAAETSLEAPETNHKAEATVDVEPSSDVAVTIPTDSEKAALPGPVVSVAAVDEKVAEQEKPAEQPPPGKYHAT